MKRYCRRLHTILRNIWKQKLWIYICRMQNKWASFYLHPRAPRAFLNQANETQIEININKEKYFTLWWLWTFSEHFFPQKFAKYTFVSVQYVGRWSCLMYWGHYINSITLPTHPYNFSTPFLENKQIKERESGKIDLLTMIGPEFDHICQ